MTTPRLTPFPAISLLARVFTSFVIISDSNNEITTLPVRPAPPSPDCTLALYGYPLDSGDDSSDENLSETAKSLHTHTTSTSVVHPLQTRPLPTSLAYCLSTGKRDLDATRLQSSHGSMENCITIHLDDIETLRASLAFVMQETMTPRARVGSLEQHDVVTRESVRITIGRLEMAKLQSRARDLEVSFWDLERHIVSLYIYIVLMVHRDFTLDEIPLYIFPCDLKETMSTTNQGMSFAEIDQIVAHRVANAIETITIYETKTRMARELMSQIER
ncbi:hypothetical protein Tco_0905937 [Tanacetum coccineum]